MSRRIYIVAAACAAALGVAGPAAAQPSTADRPIAVQVSAGGTFGNQTGGSIAVEGDYSLTPQIVLFAELGYFSNVAPRFVTDRANVIATLLGGTAKEKDKATVFDVGAKYIVPQEFLPGVLKPYNPYAGIDAGFARVSKDTKITINGTELDEGQLLAQYGTQLGNDLAGSLTKGLFGIVLGVNRDFMERYALDVSYRYSRIAAKPSDIEGDKAINVNRLQVGVIVRF